MERRSVCWGPAGDDGCSATKLKSELEAARLDVHALLHGLVRAQGFEETPNDLRRLRRLDAKLGAGLAALMTQPTTSDLMTLKKLKTDFEHRWPALRETLLRFLDDGVRIQVEVRSRATRSRFVSRDAYGELLE